MDRAYQQFDDHSLGDFPRSSVGEAGVESQVDPAVILTCACRIDSRVVVDAFEQWLPGSLEARGALAGSGRCDRDPEDCVECSLNVPVRRTVDSHRQAKDKGLVLAGCGFDLARRTLSRGSKGTRACNLPGSQGRSLCASPNASRVGGLTLWSPCFCSCSGWVNVRFLLLSRFV